MTAASDLHARLETVLREDRGRLLAALIAVLGNFELAEEALSDAVESALVHWARNGLPDNPRGWLHKVARRKAIDRIRRQRRFADRLPEITHLAEMNEMQANEMPPEIPDERLRLIFTCCHPALEPKTRVALTLRTLGGLTTGEIARAFLDRESTMGQRLSRARTKIARAGIPFAIPDRDDWNERLGSVLAVFYLIFNEGYGASTGDSPIRANLCEEAIFLTRLMNQLRPGEPEIMGLLSLMLTTHARRAARVDDAGVTVPMACQDRSVWDRPMIIEGAAILERAMELAVPGPYQIKAAISALHAWAKNDGDTDWRQIIMLYDSLARIEPSPVVLLNRAVAIGELGDVAHALKTLDRLSLELSDYQPIHAAKAEFLTRTGQTEAAWAAYDRAIHLATNAADKAFLEQQRNRLSH